MNLRMIVSRAMAPVLVALISCGGLAAQAAVIDYVGFAWESGGILPSNPGDELAIATVVTQIDPLFEVDLSAEEATLYIDGLVSAGSSTNPSTGATTVAYLGGTLRVYADPGADQDWGINPANGFVPSTFINGELVFEGEFTAFSLTLLPSGQGVFEGLLDGVAGSALAGPCSGCAYTFAGNFTSATGANIPLGYDLQVDGVLDVESTVATETVNWGSLKQLFR